MSILHKLEWRYAVKKFDSEKEVSEEQVTELLEAANLMPTAFGLQPFEIFVIHNKDLQQRLLEHSFGQEQVVQASHLIVFAARKEISKEYIHEYIIQTEKIRNLPEGTLVDYENMMFNFADSLPKDQHLAWSQRQTYIALGGFLLAAADLKVDSCPMEGFIPEKYNEVLELPEHLHTSDIIPIGYRAHDDGFQHAKKSRRELKNIVHLKYEKTEA